MAPRLTPGTVLGGLLGLAVLAGPDGRLQAQQVEERPGTPALQTTVERIQEHPLGLDLPPLDSIVRGGRIVAAGELVPGRLVVSGGTLEVLGTIDGDAVAIDGDLVIRAGGVVRGDAVAVGGRVRLDGGTVEGDMRSLSGVGPAAALATAGAPDAARSPMDETRHAVGLVLGWLMMLAIIGIGVLMFAGAHLQAVEDALARQFSRSLWTGVLGQLALLPVLLLLIVGLTLTVLGILLIPFAVVAYTLAVAGLLTLGFLAVARRTGAALARSSPDAMGAERSARLRALMVGLVFYLGLWLLAAAFTWSPIAGGIFRGLAVVVTWVALTVGLGATLLTRAGTRAVSLEPVAEPVLDELAWATPTPVTGVAAARRPTPISRAKEPM